MKLTYERAGQLGLLALFAAFVVWFTNDAWQASPTLVNMLLIGPVAALALMIAVGLAVGVLWVRPAESQETDGSGDEKESLRSRYGVAFGCILLALYVLLLEYIGFDLASVLFCGTTMVMMGQRNWLAIAIYSAIVGLIPVYVLVHMMGVPATTLFIG